MNFVSWAVFGVLFVLAESATGTFYLLAIGLAFVYPTIADYLGVVDYLQYALLGIGAGAHVLIVKLLRPKSAAQSGQAPTDVGQLVEVIEWVDETTARVMYQGKEWVAEKLHSDMPDGTHGIIKRVQYGRLVITTEVPVDPQG